MASKKSAMNGSGKAIWHENPPGQEQKLLEQLFSSNQVDETDTPQQIQMKHPLFQAFSGAVFRSHFRKARAKHGLNLRPIRSIPELGFESGTASNNIMQVEEADVVDHPKTCTTEFINPPVLMWTTDDHNVKCKLVYVVMPIISGVKEVKFELTDDGTSLIVNYTWPEILMSPQELLSTGVLEGVMSPHHPTVHSLVSSLLQAGLTEKSRPQGKIVVELPMRVQRETNTWRKEAIKKENGANLMFLEFKAFQENIVIKDADTSLFF